MLRGCCRYHGVSLAEVREHAAPSLHLLSNAHRLADRAMPLFHSISRQLVIKRRFVDEQVAAFANLGQFRVRPTISGVHDNPEHGTHNPEMQAKRR